MSSNPMQRKAKNSFILGMLLMAVISAIIIAFLALQLLNKSKKEKEQKQSLRNVYVLSTDVKSGNVITNDMLVQKTVGLDYIPNNAWGDISMFNNYSLRDKEGNDIKAEFDTETKEQKLYLEKNNKTNEIKKEKMVIPDDKVKKIPEKKTKKNVYITSKKNDKKIMSQNLN